MRFAIRTLCVLVAVAFLGGGCGTLQLTEQPVGPSFARFDAAARAGERLTVAFFGASLTWGSNATDPVRTSYRARVAEKLEARYPEARFTYIDGAIGGTGSDLGVFRLQRDCLRYETDLVFLDFSANDNLWTSPPDRLASYESLVRRIIAEGNCPVVPVIFPFRRHSIPEKMAQFGGRLAHIKIARAYGAPVGDAILHVHGLVEEDPEVADRIWNIDGIHPGDYGYQVFADAAWQGYETGVREQMVCRAPETMLHKDTYMTWSRNRISQLGTLPTGWAVGPVSRTSAWYDALMSRWLDDVVIAKSVPGPTKKTEGVGAREPAIVDPIKVKFKAACVLVFGEATVQSGKYTAVIDGNVVTRGQGDNAVAEYDLSSAMVGGGRQHYALLATGLDPDEIHTLEIRPVFSEEKEQELRLESICLAGGTARIVD